MATQQFDLNVQLEGSYIGDRVWTGEQMHGLWNVENIDTIQRSEWGLSGGWLQYRSLLTTYSMRYSPYDNELTNYYFETDMQGSGAGNYEIGVMFRFKDRNNFYYLVWNGGYQNWDGKNIRLMKRVGTSNFKLADYQTGFFDKTQVYTIRVEVNGGQIVIYLNGTKIFDFLDMNPILNGAFGPIVKGQEFAKWKEFRAKSVTPFVLNKKGIGFTVENQNFDPQTSKLIIPQTIGDYMDDVVQPYLNSIRYDSYRLNRFIIYTSNPKVLSIFDKTIGKNVSLDPSSYVYAYQEPPKAPPIPATELKGSPIDHQSIRLTWKHADTSEDGFYILDELNNVVGTVGMDVFEFIEQGLAEGTTYHRRIIAFNTAGKSEPSNEVSVTTLQTIPAAPSNFRTGTIGDNEVVWQWDDNSNNEVTFEIVRLLQDGTPLVVGTVTEGVVEWIENGLSSETSYTRAVRARNSAGTSPLSNIITVTTLEKMPDAPTDAPINFTGVGVSHDTIMWSWEDINSIKVDGYYLYDENDKRIATIFNDKTYMHQEENLHSDMEYRRKISAFNKGGEGPKTPFAWAKTLKYGHDQIGTPLPPFNLMAFDVTQDSAMLRWEYTEHEMLPAVGFKIYDDLDQVVDTVPLDVLERRIQNLLPDKTYTFYVVAYNEFGDSLTSNSVTFITERIPELTDPEGPSEEDFPEDWLDPWYGIEYDVEKESTPKIPAFQPGVGDNLDLVVRNLHGFIQNHENLDYEMYITGLYEVTEDYFPVVPFQFKVHVQGTYPNGGLYTDSTDWIKGTVQGEENGEGIKYDSPVTMKAVPDNVIIDENSYTVEFKDEDGNEIPPYFAGSTEDLKWVFESRTRMEKVGETQEIDMWNVFRDWKKFSHWGINQPARPTELDSWRYDPYTDEIFTTVNSSSYMGAVSPDYYEKYDLEMRLSSDDNDNDEMGFVMAFAIDENGREHTLSAIRSHSQTSWDWGIWYNFGQSDSLNITSMKLDTSVLKNWNQFYPTGTKVRAVRNGDSFELYASEAGVDTLSPSSLLSVNLNSDPRFELFKGPKPIGVSARSQRGASLKLMRVEATKTKVFVDNYMTVWTEKKGLKTGYKKWESIRYRNHSAKIPAGHPVKVEGRIQSPQYQIPWQELNEVTTFVPDAYQINVTSLNPNVEIVLEEEVTDFFPENSTFVTVPIKARVINHTQTSWHPGIHSGYYYLNHREFFLYSSDKVLPKDSAGDTDYQYTFPYIIKAYAERHYAGGDLWLSDRTAQEFSLGTVSEGADINGADHSVTIKDDAQSGIFTSRIFNFGQIVERWNAPIITSDHPSVNGDTGIVFEIGEADDNGAVAEWKTATDMTPASRVRYRLTMKEMIDKQPYTGYYPLSLTDLIRGFFEHTKLADDRIEIEDAQFYADGYYITPAIDITPYIRDLGSVEFELRAPDGSSIEVYSVSADRSDHNFKVPTSNEPWIPARRMNQSGDTYTYKVDSAAKQYVAFVFKLKRGMKEIQTADVRLNASSFDPTLAVNLQTAGSDIIPVDPTMPSSYESRNINLDAFQYWGSVILDAVTVTDSGIRIYTVTAGTSAELDTKALNETEWKQVTGDMIQSPVNRWMRFRLVIEPEAVRLKELRILPLKKTGVTPSLSNISYKPNLYTPIRVVPIVKKVELGGYIPAGFWAEEYVVPMTGDVIADEKFHQITDKPVKDIVLNHLASIGVNDINALTFKDYLVQTDPVYPVDIHTDSFGSTPVEAKTTAVVGDIIHREEKLYFSKDKQEVLVRPVPQNGRPIVIMNAQGTLLRPVHFRDEKGRPTLTNMEVLETNETRHLFIQYRQHEIDAKTLRVFLDLDGFGSWQEIFGCTIAENRIIFPFGVMPMRKVRAMYRLKDSYYVDYNYAPENDDALIKIHTSFDPEVTETRRVDIKYEVNKEHAFYPAEEVDLNPLKNKIHSGFIYLTDELYAPYKMKLMCNPTQLYRTKHERVTVHAYVYDEYGNPVVGEKISWETDHGTVYIMNHETDMNGLSVAIYESTDDKRISSSVVSASVIGRESSSYLSQEIVIDFIDETFANKISISPEKHIVQNGDIVQLKVTTLGPSNERLANQPVEIAVNQGSATPSSGTTDYNGELLFQYRHPAAGSDVDYVLITVTSGRTKEQIILGTSGV